MFTEEEIELLVENLVDVTTNTKEYKKSINKIEVILNTLREKEIREEIRKRWEELEREEPKPFISDVHEYSETVGSIIIDSINQTTDEVEISFTGKAYGLTEFGTELTYNVSGILTIDNSGKSQNVKYSKRELINTKPFEIDQ